MLRAISSKDVDHIPCAFMSFSALRNRQGDDFYKLCQAELDLGLDSFIFLPYLPRRARPDHPDLRGLPIRFHPEVVVNEWHEKVDGNNDILHKEYDTPGGKLSTSVQLSSDWNHGNNVPFIDDYQIPRSLNRLITKPRDLEALQFLLQPPNDEIKGFFAKEQRKASEFANEKDILLVGGWGVGMDMANWLCGMKELMMLTMTDIQFAEDLIEMIHQWNLTRMKLVLSGNVDLFIRRAWYEGCDFVLPDFYQQVILPRLKKEVELAHDLGAKFGYICSSGLIPMLDLHKEAGFDVLIGIDPIQGTHTDLARVKKSYEDKISIWGGISGAITVELGTEDEIKIALSNAVSELGPKGLILSPVDNITVDEPKTWNNVNFLINEWKSNAIIIR
ncbi:uroporphyrinogen decarboxylase family protein [Chloroflexota bacterium]